MNNKIKLMAVLFMIVGVLAGCNKNEDSSSENKIPQQTSTNKITNSSAASARELHFLFWDIATVRYNIFEIHKTKRSFLRDI